MSKSKHRNSEVQRPTSGVIRGGPTYGRQDKCDTLAHESTKDLGSPDERRHDSEATSGTREILPGNLETPQKPTVTREPMTLRDTRDEPGAELAHALAELPSDLPSRAFPVAGCDACLQGGCWIHGYTRQAHGHTPGDSR